MAIEQVTLTAHAHTLQAVRFEPVGDALATVVIAPALGVKQRFYQPFACWLRDQGYRVITFDYYGIGQSVDQPLKRIQSSLTDWAEHDIPAVIDYANACQPGIPLIWFGHSLGGQIIGMAPNHHKLDKMITVASGTGYWREASQQVRRTAWLLWYLAVPISLPLVGYFPGKRLNMIGDMPAAAMKEWSRWCRSHNYLFDHISHKQSLRYQAFQAPITAFHLTDDELLQKTNVERLLSHYPHATSTLIDLHPGMTPHDRIGHFNVFRSRFQQSLWQKNLLGALKVN